MDPTKYEQDFGTTFSGISYSFSANPSEIYVVKEWPGASGSSWDKCPTIVKYEGKVVRWGFEIDRTTEGCIEGIKLLLDPEQPRPIYVPAVDTKAELQRLNALWKHAAANIESKYPKDYFNLLKKKFVLTVPAVWSEKAQDATLRVSDYFP